jgi:hypothetical protein
LYLDASAWLKRYRAEAGADVLRDALARAPAIASCRPAQAEVRAALYRSGGAAALSDFARLWSATHVVEIDEQLCDVAAGLAAVHRLGTLDALHLAAAGTLPGEVTLATWDRRLWDATRAEGLDVLPERRP